MFRKLIVGSAAAGILIAIAAIGLGWLPPLFNYEVNPVLGFLRETSVGNYLSRVSLMMGAGLLMHIWLKFGRAILTNEINSSKTFYLIGTLPLWFIFFTPPLFSRDVYSYMAQARLALRGLNPYEYGVSWLPGWFQLGADPMWVDSPTPYGNLAIQLGMSIETLIPNSPWLALLAHRLIAYLGILLSIYWIRQLANQNGLNPKTAIWFGIFNPLTIFHFASAAHNDSLMVAFLLGSFAEGFKNRRIAALALLVAAAAIKPIALLAAPFVVLQFLRSNGSYSVAIKQLLLNWITSAILVVSALLVLGKVSGLGIGWIGALSTPTSVRTLLSPTTLLGELVAWPIDFFNFVSSDLVVQLFHFAGVAIALLGIVKILRTQELRSPIRSAAFAFTLVVVLSPVVQPWYIVWLMILFSVAGINHTWSLQNLVLATGFFVAYSAVDVNVVLDSALTWSDFAAGLTAAFTLAFVVWASPSERRLIFGPQFNEALTPHIKSVQAAAPKLP